MVVVLWLLSYLDIYQTATYLIWPTLEETFIRAMAPNVDSVILDALGLDLAATKIGSHGGSGFASTFKISTTVDGKETNYFVKTGSGPDAELMFQGTYASQGSHPLLVTHT